MREKLNVDLFRFDASCDYLPYYLSCVVEFDKSSKVEHLLEQISKRVEGFSYKNKTVLCRINGRVALGNEMVSQIIRQSGYEWRVEPVSTYRCTKDLTINDDDFQKSFELIAEFADEDDRVYFDSLYAHHYASSGFEFEKSYIGDAVLLCAHRMIFEKKSIHSDKIIKSIAGSEFGLFSCEYEHRLYGGADEAKKIEELKDLARGKKGSKAPAHRQRRELDATNIEAFGIYSGYLNDNIYTKEGIKFERSGSKCGVELLPENRELALKKAAIVLLDAMDSGVQRLFVEDAAAYEFLSRNKRSIARASNRDIDMQII